MRRRLAVLLSAVLAASTLAVLAQTQPAQADTDVCAGTGQANIAAPGLYAPGFPNQAAGGLTTIDNTTTAPTPLTTTTTVNIHTAKLLVFGFALSPPPLGNCVAKAGLSASGMVSGWCGHSWGEGVTNNGHRFAWVSAGTFLLITGELVGVVSATADTLGGQSCLTGALIFNIVGAVGLIHCTVKNKLSNLIITDTHNLTTTTTAGHTFNTHVTTTGNYHVSHKVCIGV